MNTGPLSALLGINDEMHGDGCRIVDMLVRDVGQLICETTVLRERLRPVACAQLQRP